MRRGYRNRSSYISTQECRNVIDRNQRAKIIWIAEQIEANTKPKGRQNGAVSRAGLILLRALLFRFTGKDGRCFPSYSALERATGLCRATVALCLSRLERCGLLHIIRRLERREVVDELGRAYVGTVQASNAYVFDTGSGGHHLLTLEPVFRVFPARRQLSLWANIVSKLDPSLSRRV